MPNDGPTVHVLNSHLRRGLGRKLMHALGGAMAGQGHGAVALWSLASNQSARAFYERIGGRLSSVLVEQDRDARLVLAGYRWRSAAELADRDIRCVSRQLLQITISEMAALTTRLSDSPPMKIVSVSGGLWPRANSARSRSSK